MLSIFREKVLLVSIGDGDIFIEKVFWAGITPLCGRGGGGRYFELFSDGTTSCKYYTWRPASTGRLADWVKGSKNK